MILRIAYAINNQGILKHRSNIRVTIFGHPIKLQHSIHAYIGCSFERVKLARGSEMGAFDSSRDSTHSYALIIKES